MVGARAAVRVHPDVRRAGRRGGPVTWAVAEEGAVADPALLVAVTTTQGVEPRSVWVIW